MNDTRSTAAELETAQKSLDYLRAEKEKLIRQLADNEVESEKLIWKIRRLSS